MQPEINRIIKQVPLFCCLAGWLKYKDIVDTRIIDQRYVLVDTLVPVWQIDPVPEIEMKHDLDHISAEKEIIIA